MQVNLNLTPEQEAELIDIAKHQGTTPDAFVTEMVLGLIDEAEDTRESIRRALAQAERGEFVSEEEMDRRLEKMLRR